MLTPPTPVPQSQQERLVCIAALRRAGWMYRACTAGGFVDLAEMMEQAEDKVFEAWAARAGLSPAAREYYRRKP